MKLKLKEDPKEWRKITILSAIALAVFCTVLKWRHVLPLNGWLAALMILGLTMIFAWARPVWFRGYYRWSSRAGFCLSQFVGSILLMLLFFLVLTPLGLILRLCGKDLLRLKPPTNATTYWNSTKGTSPLDRLF